MKSNRYFQAAIIIFALVFGNSSMVFCQSPQNNPTTLQIQIVKDQVKKLGNGEDVTVILFSGMEYYGAISKIEAESFEIAEVDLKQMVSIAYTDVKKVEKGYGEMNSSNGRRQSKLKSRFGLILIIVGVAAVVGILIWGVSKTKKPDFPTPSPQFP